MSGVLFCLLYYLVNANVRAYNVVVGIVISAGVIIGNEIRLGRIGLQIGEDIVDLIGCGLVFAKTVEGSADFLGRINGAEASVCGKNGLDNG